MTRKEWRRGLTAPVADRLPRTGGAELRADGQGYGRRRFWSVLERFISAL
ncbi:hypothetical protein GCM10011578_022110 [Streptomyces fuscichromogenes]|uniref:Uncharacterized protein n=1 Tax=Streptomyces fuscichromogenes TaxID=1324013 RepID=A0A917XA94_9ACTN|nr:hypothetical protein GCM10011578_022110 [Streptomyces fuscichromogenes]